MDNKYKNLYEMAQHLVDNHVITKEEKCNLQISDYMSIKSLYDKLSIGLYSISHWDNKKFDHIYNKIN